MESGIHGAGEYQAAKEGTLKLNPCSGKEGSGLPFRSGHDQGISLSAIHSFPLREDLVLIAGHYPDRPIGFQQALVHDIDANFTARISRLDRGDAITHTQGILPDRWIFILRLAGMRRTEESTEANKGVQGLLHTSEFMQN